MVAARAQDPPPAPIAWEGPYTFFPQTGSEIEHSALIGKPGPHQGKVILVRDHINNGLWLWDPAAPTTVSPANPLDNFVHNVGCGGQSWDADGNLVFAGGDKDTDCGPEPIWTTVLQPDQLYWEDRAAMLVPTTPPPRFGYYYPSTVALHDGTVVSIGGESSPWRPTCGAAPQHWYTNYWLRYDGTTNTWLGNGTSPLLGLPSPYRLTSYPRVHLLSTGQLFATAVQACWVEPVPPHRSYSPSAYVNVGAWPPGSWTMHPYGQHLKNTAGQTVDLFYASSVLLPYVVSQPFLGVQDTALLVGGWDRNKEATYDRPPPVGGGTGSPAEDNVWRIDNPLQPSSAWGIPAQYGTMFHRRIFQNLVLLPDLTLLVVGGSANWFGPYNDSSYEVPPQPVYEPELLDLLNPAAGWQRMDPHQSPRLYHSTALLLKDGRVFVASGYKRTLPIGALPHSDVEVFIPPCIRQPQPRPSILNPPAQLNYGAPIPALQISLPGSANPGQEILFATLVRCGAATHHCDTDQRCIKLELTSASGNMLTLAQLPSQAQGGPFLAPPGYYMLFVVTTPRGNPQVRVPSIGVFVRVS